MFVVTSEKCAKISWRDCFENLRIPQRDFPPACPVIRKKSGKERKVELKTALVTTILILHTYIQSNTKYYSHSLSVVLSSTFLSFPDFFS